MSLISIRKIGLDDIYLLQKISKATFIETFSTQNTAQNMQDYLKNDLAIEKLETELTSVNSNFYFAEEGDAVLGYMKLNIGDAQTEPLQDDGMEIERIYVLQQFLGKGIGKQLFEFAMQQGRLWKKTYLWLGVWEENQRAIQFYHKQGMVAFDKHIFRLGDDEQIDVMMKLPLNP